jgi:hypothetical protein
MQAQTLETQKSTTPWLALVLSLLFAATIVVVAQTASRDQGETTVAPQAQIVDPGVGLQKAGMSQAGITSVGGTAIESTMSFHHGRPPLSPDQIAAAQALLRGADRDPGLAATMARIMEVRLARR